MAITEQELDYMENIYLDRETPNEGIAHHENCWKYHVYCGIGRLIQECRILQENLKKCNDILDSLHGRER